MNILTGFYRSTMNQSWYYASRKRIYALKGPRSIALFSERYKRGVRVIPLGFGWRITIRRRPA